MCFPRWRRKKIRGRGGADVFFFFFSFFFFLCGQNCTVLPPDLRRERTRNDDIRKLAQRTQSPITPTVGMMVIQRTLVGGGSFPSSCTITMAFLGVLLTTYIVVPR
jgi:hypothetical protein